MLSQAVDIHRAFADKVFQQFEKLHRTACIGAAMHRFGFGFDHLRSAHRAVGRHLKHLFLAGSAVQDGANDLWDDVSGPFHRDPVANPDILAVDVFFVVERGLPDGDAANHHRLQNGVGIEAAGAAHVDANVQQPGYRLLRRELKSDGPSRLPADNSQGILVGEWVYFYHDAVYFVG